jgi:hypothetical protein
VRPHRHSQEARLRVDVRVHGDPFLDVLGVERGDGRVVRHLGTEKPVLKKPQLSVSCHVPEIRVFLLLFDGFL